MKSDRRQKQQMVSDALAKELETTTDKLKRWGNTALTVLLVIAVIALLVRWRMNRAEQARQLLVNELSIAESYVQDLRRDLSQQPPEFLARFKEEAAGKATEAISVVLNSDADATQKARALATRGDLYWELANFPDLPGADKDPNLRPTESADSYLTKAADSYQQILNTEDYTKQRESAMAAHFGLAAIAENRHNWPEAAKHLQIVLADESLPPSIRSYAARQLQNLQMLQVPLYMAPASQPTSAPSSQPIAGPAGPPIPMGMQPTTRNTAATTQPLH